MRLFYHDAEGRLTGQASGAFSPEELVGLAERQLFLTVPDDAAFAQSYVLDGELAARPVAPITINRTEIPADKLSKVKIAGLPDPCVVLVDGEPVTVAGGLLELTADMPATYSIVFDQFPYMPWSAEITAT
ncbi:hypothetical protein [Kaistia nematophila]|uniref:Uncharacterized protein n=2 Tax=Kaistia TaxID=166953 RepID=A0A9X3E3E0_9HYPH|nr:hypothetical protein [Kaistia nematophila]MCX5570627.1 hypothetical protein [Kaistia nematophila]